MVSALNRASQVTANNDSNLPDDASAWICLLNDPSKCVSLLCTGPTG